MNDTTYKAACGRKRLITAEWLQQLYPLQKEAPDAAPILMAWNGDSRAESEELRTDKVYFEECLTCPHLDAQLQHVWPRDGVPANEIATVRLCYCMSFRRVDAA